MAVIGIRELARETRKVLDQLEEDGEPVIVARHGKPVAVLAVPTREQLVDADLAATPEFHESLDEANRELAEGETKPFGEVLSEIETEEGRKVSLAELVEALDKYEPLVAAAHEDLDTWVAAHVPGEYLQRVKRLNAHLVKATVTDSVGEALGDVQLINEELASLANGPHGLSPERYVMLLEGAVVQKQAQQRHGRGLRTTTAWGILAEDLKEIA